MYTSSLSEFHLRSVTYGAKFKNEWALCWGMTLGLWRGKMKSRYFVTTIMGEIGNVKGIFVLLLTFYRLYIYMQCTVWWSDIFFNSHNYDKLLFKIIKLIWINSRNIYEWKIATEPPGVSDYVLYIYHISHMAIQCCFSYSSSNTHAHISY